MATNPRVQDLVQKEMDGVLKANGVDFPTFEHRSTLPYLEAVIKETMRWHPALPLSWSTRLPNWWMISLARIGIARRTSMDDMYKGTEIFANFAHCYTDICCRRISHSCRYGILVNVHVLILYTLTFDRDYSRSQQLGYCNGRKFQVSTGKVHSRETFGLKYHCR